MCKAFHYGRTDLATLFEDDDPNLPPLLGFELFQTDGSTETGGSSTNDAYVYIVFCALDLFLGGLFCDRRNRVIGHRGKAPADRVNRGGPTGAAVGEPGGRRGGACEQRSG